MWIRMKFGVLDYLEQRRPMMQWWADFVKAADNGSMIEGGIKSMRLVG